MFSRVFADQDSELVSELVVCYHENFACKNPIHCCHFVDSCISNMVRFFDDWKIPVCSCPRKESDYFPYTYYRTVMGEMPTIEKPPTIEVQEVKNYFRKVFISKFEVVNKGDFIRKQIGLKQQLEECAAKLNKNVTAFEPSEVKYGAYTKEIMSKHGITGLPVVYLPENIKLLEVLIDASYNEDSAMPDVKGYFDYVLYNGEKNGKITDRFNTFVVKRKLYEPTSFDQFAKASDGKLYYDLDADLAYLREKKNYIEEVLKPAAENAARLKKLMLADQELDEKLPVCLQREIAYWLANK